MTSLSYQHHDIAWLRRRCRRSDSTRSRRCQWQCRPSWRWVECRVCWARTSCLTDGSCTSHRSTTDGTSSYTADDNPLGACLPHCWSSSVLHDSATPNLRTQPAVRRVWSFHCHNYSYEWHESLYRTVWFSHSTSSKCCITVSFWLLD